MEETPENGKESSHSAHANGMNEWINSLWFSMLQDKTYKHCQKYKSYHCQIFAIC
jgi:hypothetical protein